MRVQGDTWELPVALVLLRMSRLRELRMVELFLVINQTIDGVVRKRHVLEVCTAVVYEIVSS